MDLAHYRVNHGDQPLMLSYREYALLVYVASRAGQAVPKRQLLEEGLGRHDPGGLRIVDEHVRHLNHVLAGTGATIQVINDQAYRFTSEKVSDTFPRSKSV